MALGAIYSYMLLVGSETVPELVLFAGFAVIANAVGHGVTQITARKVMPAFEFLPVGGSGPGTRRVAIAGAFGLFVLANIVLPIVLAILNLT